MWTWIYLLMCKSKVTYSFVTSKNSDRDFFTLPFLSTIPQILSTQRSMSPFSILIFGYVTETGQFKLGHFKFVYCIIA